MHDDGVLHAWFIFNLHTKVSFVFTQHTDLNIHTIYKQFYQTPCKTIRNPYLLGGPASCSWWWIPIHPGLQSGNKWPTLWLSPLSHPIAHITLFTKTTSIIAVFFVQDNTYTYTYLYLYVYVYIYIYIICIRSISIYSIRQYSTIGQADHR